MSDIDWNEAPEGATYCAPEGLSREPQVCWYRRHEGWWEYFSPNRREWRLSANGPEFHDRLMPRPTQWCGPEDGLPPVGAEVEAWIENRKVWAKVTVLAVDVDTVVWRNGTDRRSYIGTHVNDVRPLKSDKDRVIDAAVAATILKDGPRIRSALSDIYDAGLLRLPEGQS